MEKECICGKSGTSVYCNDNNVDCWHKKHTEKPHQTDLWIKASNTSQLPLNESIIAKSEQTICAIQNYNGNWTFWHSNTNVPPTFINEVTHYLIPTL